MMSKERVTLAAVLGLLFSACSVTEGDILQGKKVDLGVTESPPALSCITELISAMACTTELDLSTMADARCAAHGKYRVDVTFMASGCGAGLARSASATCCPSTRPPHCTPEQQRPADLLCRSGVALIDLADKACAVLGKRALIQDLLDYCQNGQWLGVSYLCCE
jgi:hypothetical protein